MHTKTREIKIGGISTFRCFTTLKQKSGFDFPLDQSMPWTPAKIGDKKVRHLVKRLASGETCQEVRFERHVAVNPESDIFISIDFPFKVPVLTGAYWLEIKSRGNLDELRKISDYIAWKLPVRATTQMKCEALIYHDDHIPGNANRSDGDD